MAVEPRENFVPIQHATRKQILFLSLLATVTYGLTPDLSSGLGYT